MATVPLRPGLMQRSELTCNRALDYAATSHAEAEASVAASAWLKVLMRSHVMQFCFPRLQVVSKGCDGGHSDTFILPFHNIPVQTMA